MDLFENGTFMIPGADGKTVRCEVLFTYDWEITGEKYVVFRMEGADQLSACRVVETENGGSGLAPLRTEAERDFLNHCFEELKAKLRAEGETEGESAQ